MKKIAILSLLICCFSASYSQSCNSFGTGDICQNFKNNNQTQKYQACCACGNSPQRTNTAGCPPSAPINKGLIFLITAGLGAGVYTILRQRSMILR